MAIRIRCEYQIDAQPQDVLAAMTDFQSWPEWMEGLLDVEKLTDGEYGVGTRWREKRRLMGAEATEQFEVTAFEPPHRIDLYVDGSQGSTGRGEYRFAYRLTPSPSGGTHFVMDGEIEMPGLVAKVMGFALKPMMKRGCDRDNRALKKYVESKTSKLNSGK